VPNILVADDNTNIQKMVSLALEERGINVVAVGNGEAAVRRMPDVNPDLVLADIFMPVRNGYEVCEFVKKDERFAHVPVILLVGAFDPLDEKEARRVGADGVLKKPFVPPDPLIAMVVSALERNPRVAAEMAKAKEAKVAEPAAPPVDAAALEIPARLEPKPLPEFPEPSAEEAALVYGFGSGKRGREDALEDEVKQAKAPAAPAKEASEDDFDAAETASDWRRAANDFEVPAEANSKPAFSTEEDPNPITFPSERDVPPKRIRVLDLVDDYDPDAPEPKPAASAPPISTPVVASTSAVERAPEPVSKVKQPAPEVSEARVAETAPEPEDSVAPAAPHWMDAVAPPSPDLPSSAWMEAITGEQPERQPAAAQPPARPAPLVSNSAQDDSFFAEEASGEPQHAQNWPADEFASTAAPSLPASGAPRNDSQIEFDPENSEPSLAMKDPDLDESPAVRVAPEPLLVEEESSGPSDYGASEQDTAPLHEFLAPAAQNSRAEPAREPASPPRDEHSSSWVEASPEADERIPTMPPPNREALAEIPFLTPPPEILHPTESSASDPAAVDAAVQKVLEKLEPQLHSLLSQGLLKPLIENLLQSELAKKEK
jgi:CheY-like chemotaxis protein